MENTNKHKLNCIFYEFITLSGALQCVVCTIRLLEPGVNSVFYKTHHIFIANTGNGKDTVFHFFCMCFSLSCTVKMLSIQQLIIVIV